MKKNKDIDIKKTVVAAYSKIYKKLPSIVGRLNASIYIDKGYDGVAYVSPPSISGSSSICISGDIFNHIDPEDLKFVLLHELFHLHFGHFSRIGNRDRNLWNVATDMVINETIAEITGWKTESGIWADNVGFDEKKAELVRSGITEGTLAAEDIYDILLSENIGGQENIDHAKSYMESSEIPTEARDNATRNGTDSGRENDKETGKGNGTKNGENRKDGNNKGNRKNAVKVADAEDAKRAASKNATPDHTPSGAADKIGRIESRKSAIIGEVRKLATKIRGEWAREDITSTWRRPNHRRWGAKGKIPYTEDGTLLVALDVSGSMSHEWIAIGLGLVRALSSVFGSVSLVTVADKVYSDHRWERGRKVDRNSFHIGGGTAYGQAVKWAAGKAPNGGNVSLVVIGDGETYDISSITVPKNMRVLWAIFGDNAETFEASRKSSSNYSKARELFSRVEVR